MAHEARIRLNITLVLDDSTTGATSYEVETDEPTDMMLKSRGATLDAAITALTTAAVARKSSR